MNTHEIVVDTRNFPYAFFGYFRRDAARRVYFLWSGICVDGPGVLKILPVSRRLHVRIPVRDFLLRAMAPSLYRYLPSMACVSIHIHMYMVVSRKSFAKFLWVEWAKVMAKLRSLVPSAYLSITRMPPGIRIGAWTKEMENVEDYMADLERQRREEDQWPEVREERRRRRKLRRAAQAAEHNPPRRVQQKITKYI